MSEHIVVMGVSGTGKTTIGRQLARRLGWDFVEGDDLHPTANVAQMRAGVPLTDTERLPWLRRVRDAIATSDTRGRSSVVACSALRRSYRDLLRTAPGHVRFVHLVVPRDELVRRLAHRQGHFMPASLLDSQLATLEPLEADEDGVDVAVSGRAGVTVRTVLDALG